MPEAMTISQVARRIGLRPSAIRYYEAIGILARGPRVGGQRRYDETVLYRLALVGQARACGFTLEEIRRLFFAFRAETPISERWRSLSDAKLAELAERRRQIEEMEGMLRRLRQGCSCRALDECGRCIYVARGAVTATRPRRVARRGR